MSRSFQSKTMIDLGYSFFSRLFVFLLATATGIVLARNLTASDYGIVGFAMIFVSFLQQFNDVGISPAVIQKEEMTERGLYTAFTLKLALGLLLFAASFLWGNLSVLVFDNPAVKPVLVVLSLSFIISGFRFLPLTVMTRELGFKRLTVPLAGSQIAGTAAAISFVYLGFRYWSIVGSELAAALAFVLILNVLRPVPFKLRFDYAQAREYLKFGGSIFLAGLTIFALFNADNFMIGALAGSEVLGFYAVAFNWSTKAPGLLSESLNSVLLSSFSRVQRERETLRQGYLTVLEYAGLLAVLANVLLLILSRDFLWLILGNGTAKWLPALSALRILCVYGVVRSLLEPIGNVVIALGKPGLILKSNLAGAAIELAGLYPVLVHFGIEGVSVLVTVAYAAQFLILFPGVRRELGLPFSEVFRSVRPALASGIVLALFGFTLDRFIPTSWLSLTLKLTLGCGVYFLAHGFLTGWSLLKNTRSILATGMLRSSGA